jgi:predicted PurR-regulated permease PerM
MVFFSNLLRRYFHQELLLGTVVGSMTLIGLLIFGVPFARVQP